MADFKFAQSHEWIFVEGEVATIGISDHAQKELGDIVFVELPEVGGTLTQSQQFGTIESTKAASELYAPVSGTVLEVHEALLQNPQWINESAQEKGWMVKVKIANLAEVDTLLDEGAYQALISKETHNS